MKSKKLSEPRRGEFFLHSPTPLAVAPEVQTGYFLLVRAQNVAPLQDKQKKSDIRTPHLQTVKYPDKKTAENRRSGESYIQSYHEIHSVVS